MQSVRRSLQRSSLIPTRRSRKAHGLMAAAAASLIGAYATQAATITKADTNTLNLGADWTGGVAPGAFDIALFDTTISALNAGNLSLGANLSWQGLTVGSVNGPVVITPTGAFTLTLGPSGINMTAATDNLAINSNFTLMGAQAWSAASGRTLDISGGTFTRKGATVDFTNFNAGATLTGITNDASGILGAWATTGSGTTLNYVKNNAGLVTAFTTQTAGTVGTLANVTSATTNYSYGAAANTTTNLTANTLRYTGGATTTAIGAANTLTLNGLMNAGTGTLTISGGPTTGGILIGATNELVITANTQATTISSVIANGGGAGSVTYSGAGNLTLSGANTFTGGFALNSGTLTLGSSTVGAITSGPVGTGTLTLAGGTLTNTGGARTIANAISVTGTTVVAATTGDFFLSGAISGNGTFNSNGTGSIASLDVTTATLSGFTGTVNYVASANNNLFFRTPLNTTANFTVSGSANQQTLRFENGSIIGGLSGTGGRILAMTGNDVLTINQSATTTFSGLLNNDAGNFGIIKTGSGTLTLGGANNYQGGTTINGGTLRLSTGGTFGNSNFASQLTLNTGGTADLNDVNLLVGNFTGTGGTVVNNGSAAATFTIGNINGGGGNFQGVIANNNNAGTGVLALTKIGTAIITLSGANTYTGVTTLGTVGSTVSAGTLTVSGAAGSISGSSSISINGIQTTNGNGNGSLLNLDYTIAGSQALNRVGNSTAVTLGNGGELALVGNATTSIATTEKIGVLGFRNGSGILTLNASGVAGTSLTLTADSISRTNNATGLIRAAQSLGVNSTGVGKLALMDNGASLGLVGTTAAVSLAAGDATKNLKISTFLFGDTGVAGAGSTFVTYDTGLNTVRGLTSGEYQTYALAANGDENVAVGATTTGVTGKTINSLLFNTGVGSLVGTGAGQTLTVNSGVIYSQTGSNTSLSGFDGGIILKNGEGVIGVAAANNFAIGATFTIGSAITITDVAGAGNSGKLTKFGGGNLILTASNNYTGITTVNQGTLTIGSGTTGDLGPNSANIILNTGTTLAFARTNAGLTIANNISGAGAVTENGAGGTTVLTGTNTQTGATTITNGTLQFNSAAAMSTGSALVLNGGVLALRNDGPTTFTPASTTITGTVGISVDNLTAGTGNTLTLGGPISVGTATINVTNGNSYVLGLGTVTGISDAGGGITTTFNVASGASLTIGALTNNTAVSPGYAFTGAGNTTVGPITTVTGVATSGRSVNMFFNQTGMVTLTGANNFTGKSNQIQNFLVNSGTVVLNNSSAMNGLTGAAPNVVTLGNATPASTAAANLLLGGTNSTGTNGGITIARAVSIQDTTSGQLTIGGQNTSNTNTYNAGITLGTTLNTGKSLNLAAAAGGQMDFTGIIANNGTDTSAGISVNNNALINAASTAFGGVVRLSGANTYRGTTTIAGGNLLADSANALNTTALGGNVTFTGGTLKYGSTFAAGANADVSGRVKNSTAAIAVDTNANNVTYASVLASTNVGGLTKLGAGTLSLSGANAYTGATAINRGTLLVAGTGSTTAGSTVTVGDGTNAAKLAGTGTLAGSVTVANAATIAPADTADTAAKLSVANGGSKTLTFEAGSTYEFDFDGAATDGADADNVTDGAGTSYDTLDAGTGTVAITAPGGGAQSTRVTVMLKDLVTNTMNAAANYRWLLAAGTGTVATADVTNLFFFDITGLAGTGVTADQFSADTVAGSGLYVGYAPVAVPEPGSLLGLGIPAAAWALKRRRRHLVN